MRSYITWATGLALGLAAVGGAATYAAGQTQGPLQSGSASAMLFRADSAGWKVRATWTGGHSAVGPVRFKADDTVKVGETNVRTSDLILLERGRLGKAPVVRGAVIGAVLGAVLPVVVAAPLCNSDSNCGRSTLARAGVIGGIAGAILGGVGFSLASSKSTWQTIWRRTP